MVDLNKLSSRTFTAIEEDRRAFILYYGLQQETCMLCDCSFRPTLGCEHCLDHVRFPGVGSMDGGGRHLLAQGI